jgi:hypothetical protein
MHLCDDALLEPSQQDKFHLSQCRLCQQRQLNLVKFREQLSNLPIKEPLNKDWNKTFALYKSRSQKPKPDCFEDKRLKFSALKTLLAASLVLFVIGISQYMGSAPESIKFSKLTYSIKQNDLLQKEIHNARSEIYQRKFSTVRYQISQVNKEIQHAYFELRSEDELFRLWQKKIRLIRTFLNGEQSNHFTKV